MVYVLGEVGLQSGSFRYISKVYSNALVYTDRVFLVSSTSKDMEFS